ncbi:MFS transporter [Amycolatopsis magusensis]|uniref:MFS family permease n=1 Tax=Amycolatopsis magusensis TaxID=882444 RepID=A0ABS4PML4_9PSEU|nr:MFS transporter [Amycolatopsis magusensis]MBP2180663.1 MFS family permease [Amycolatopsis magusensis]
MAGRDRRLTWLLSASSASNLGDGVGKVAFPLLAATLTRDPLLIAGLSATQFLPWLLFALPVGALLDRVDRRRAIVVANATRALLVGTLAGLVLAGAVSIWVVYAFGLLLGVVETVADSAANVLIPAVAGEDELESANSKLQAVEVVGQNFLGGPLGGVAFAFFAAFPFLLNSAGFALAAALLLGISGSYRPAAAEPGSVRVRIAGGLRWLRGNPFLSRLVLIAGATALLIEMPMAQLVLYGLEDLRLSEVVFGVFASGAGVGGLLGAAVAPRLISRFGRRWVLLGGLFVVAVLFTGLGLLAYPVVAGVLYGLFGAAVVVVNVVLGTLRHVLVPSEYLGRVMGAWRTVVWGAVPLGALLGGLAASVLGSASATFVLSGVLQVVLVFVAAWVLSGRTAEFAAKPEPAWHDG